MQDFEPHSLLYECLRILRHKAMRCRQGLADANGISPVITASQGYDESLTGRQNKKERTNARPMTASNMVEVISP